MKKKREWTEVDGYQNDGVISLKIAEPGQFALILKWLYLAGFLEMLRLYVSSMTLHILCCRMNVSVFNLYCVIYWVVWLHSEGKLVDSSKLSAVISLYWACEVSGTWLLIAVICSIPAASSSHWPTISFISSIHKSYCMSVRSSMSTNCTHSCSDKECKDRKCVFGRHVVIYVKI